MSIFKSQLKVTPNDTSPNIYLKTNTNQFKFNKTRLNYPVECVAAVSEENMNMTQLKTHTTPRSKKTEPGFTQVPSIIQRGHKDQSHRAAAAAASPPSEK